MTLPKPLAFMIQTALGLSLLIIVIGWFDDPESAASPLATTAVIEATSTAVLATPTPTPALIWGPNYSEEGPEVLAPSMSLTSLISNTLHNLPHPRSILD